MDLRRLSWAGIEATTGASRVLIDPLQNVRPLAGFLGAPRGRLINPTIDRHTWVAITHLHPDHCDRSLLRRLPPGRAICHEPIGNQLALERVSTTAAGLLANARR